jgi:hypothetical protein
MQPATDSNPQFIHSQDGTNNNQTQLGKRETMQHPTKATQQAKTLFDETTQIELVEQANTLTINFYTHYYTINSYLLLVSAVILFAI